MAVELFNAKPWLCQPTKVGLKTGLVSCQLKANTSKSIWFLSLSWSYLAFYTTDGVLNSQVEMNESVFLDISNEISITSKEGNTFVLYPQNDQERCSWGLSIGSILQLHQSHWSDQEIVKVFETLSARLIQLSYSTTSPQHSEACSRLSDIILEIFLAYTSQNRNERLQIALKKFSAEIQNFVSIASLIEITNALEQIMERISEISGLPVPQKQVELNEKLIEKQNNSNSTTTIAATTTTTNQKSNNSSSNPNSPVTSATHAGRRAHQSNLGTQVVPGTQFVSSSIHASNQPSSSNSLKSSSRSSPLQHRFGSDDQFSILQTKNAQKEAEDAETLQESILRLVKQIRSLFVKSVEAFKLYNVKIFKKIQEETEKVFQMLKCAYEELLKPLVSQAVLPRLREYPNVYYKSWQQAHSIVESVLTMEDRNAAISYLRENLPIVGDKMGQASHNLNGAVFEAAQQMHAEEEVRSAIQLFNDVNVSKLAQFSSSIAKNKNTKPTTNGGTTFSDNSSSNLIYSPPTSPRSILSPLTSFFGRDSVEIAHKVVLFGQAMVKICSSCFFEILAPEQVEKHLNDLERVYNALDKIISDSESEYESKEQDLKDSKLQATFLDAICSTRDFAKLLISIIEGLTNLESETNHESVKVDLQTFRESQKFNSKLNIAQLQFSSACKQLYNELMKLIEQTQISVLEPQKALSTVQKIDSPTSTSKAAKLANSDPSISKTDNHSIFKSSRQAASSESLSNSTNQISSQTSEESLESSQKRTEFKSLSEKLPSKKNLINLPKIPALNLNSNSSNSQSSSPSSGSPVSTSTMSPISGESLWRKSVPKHQFNAAQNAENNSPKNDQKLSTEKNYVTYTIDGYDIIVPESINMYMEPEEGNIKYLKGSELENDSELISQENQSNSSNQVNQLNQSNSSNQLNPSNNSNSPLSPRSSKFFHSKVQSSINLTTSASNSTDSPLSSRLHKESSHQHQNNQNNHQKTESLKIESFSANETNDSLTSSSTSSTTTLATTTTSSSSSSPHSNSLPNLPALNSSLSSISLSSHSSQSTHSSHSLSNSQNSHHHHHQHSSSQYNLGNLRRPEPILASATMNKLVMKLTNESTVEVNFIKCFLMTYRSFTTPEEFWIKLLERFNVPPISSHSSLTPEAYKKSIALPIRLRVINVIVKWLMMCWADLSIPLLKHIEYFINITLAQQDDVKGLQKKLKTMLERAYTKKTALQLSSNSKAFGRSRAHMDRAKAFEQVIVKARDMKLFEPLNIFLDDSVEPQKIAEQLTAVDWSFYSKITPIELLNKSWSKDDKTTSPNVRKMIQRFNEVSSWVASTILWQELIAMRQKVYCKIIHVAQCLFNLHNFNTTLSIISGLNNAAVHRLKFTAAEIPKKEKQMLANLMEKMNSKGSYKEYRALLKNVTPPIIPYLGVYLTDLTFIEDGNPDNIGHLINFHKRRLVNRVLTEIEQYQLQAYTIPEDPRLANTLGKLNFADDNELYNLSLLREPRNAERADIR